MKIYQPIVSGEHEWVLPIDDSGHERIRSLDQPTGPWVPLDVRIVRDVGDGRSRLPADLPWLASNVLILSPRAMRLIGSTLSAWGELLPLRCDETTLHLFNARLALPALDTEQSTITRFESGRILDIHRFAFQTSRIGDAQVFRLKELRNSPIFLTDRIVARIERHDLAGTSFREVWQGG